MRIAPSASFARYALLFAGLAVALAASAPSIAAAPVQPLLEGVRQIAAPGVPGPLGVFAGKAFPVVAGKSGEHLAVVVAAAAWKSGRVVAFGHNGYFNGKTLALADTGRLMLNAVRWAGKNTPAHPERLHVAVWRQNGLLAFLKQQGIHAEALEPGDWPRMVAACQVVCLDTGGLTEGQVRAVAQFVQQGGGLVASSLGWGWLQLHPGKTLPTDHPGNRLLAPAGIVWLDGTLPPHGRRRLCGGHAAAAVLPRPGGTGSPRRRQQRREIVGQAGPGPGAGDRHRHRAGDCRPTTGCCVRPSSASRASTRPT